MRGRCTVALSGGVDSAVTALLLKKDYDLFGMTLRLCEGFDPAGAEALCRRLDIPFEVLDAREGFRENVIDPFIATYESGGTPNPCIFCNRTMKFPELLRLADKNGSEKIATGHYARVVRDGGRYLLCKAKDPKKDQSYVLAVLDQKVLSRLLLPLGEYSKDEVRELAREAGLRNAENPDSQDICFIPDGDYGKFIRETTGKTYPQGAFRDTDGKILGRHAGMLDYTIGQRRGLGLPLGYHAYVVSKNAETGDVVVGRNEDLFSEKMYVKDLHLIAADSIPDGLKVSVKTRYSAKECPAALYMTGEKELCCAFASPVRAVTPGQTAVFYDGEIVVGCGEIVG